jgi:hypothetical protein
MRRLNKVLHLGFIEVAAPLVLGSYRNRQIDISFPLIHFLLPMKKFLLSAMLLTSISFASNAAVTPKNTQNVKATTHSKSSAKSVLLQDVIYCQTVNFSCGSTAVCGSSWEDYIDCLEEARDIFSCH